MGLFKSTQLFYDVSGYADDVASSLMSTLRYDGYEVDGVKLPSGEWDISVKKGNLFKAVLGLQTALKILTGYTSYINFLRLVAFCDPSDLGSNKTSEVG